MTHLCYQTSELALSARNDAIYVCRIQRLTARRVASFNAIPYTNNGMSVAFETAIIRRLKHSCIWPYPGSTPGAGNLSQSNQPPRSTQPGHPSMCTRNEYRPKGGDALRLGVKADMVSFAGNTVWSISERVRGVCVDALYKSTYTYTFVRYHWVQLPVQRRVWALADPPKWEPLRALLRSIIITVFDMKILAHCTRSNLL